MDIPKYFATKNLNKLREVNEILGMQLEHRALELIEPQSLDLNEVVRLKAEAAYAQFGAPILVEDTSLEFSAWRGLPGPLIKWFLEAVGAAGILKMLAGENDRSAVARTAFAYFDGKSAHIFLGETSGKIAAAALGESGFGWDPLFIPEGFEQSFAQLGAAIKNKTSPRAKALFELKRQSGM